MNANRMAATRALAGTPLSTGIAFGSAYVHRDMLDRNHQYYDIELHEVDEEFVRIEQAIEEVASDLSELSGRIEDELDEDMAAIFNAQGAILKDPSLKKKLQKELRSELSNSEHIIKTVFRRLEKKMQANANTVMQERGADFADLARRLICSLKGIRAHVLEGIPEGTILCAKTLLPSDTVYLPRQRLAGVLVERGGVASHAAILTREMGIPAISGIADLLSHIQNGEAVALDATTGKVVLNPGQNVIATLLAKKESLDKDLSQAQELCKKPALTPSGKQISVSANIGGSADALTASENGADGIGLFRLETFFMQQRNIPTAEQLFSMLSQVLRPMQKRSVTIRLLDLGADKNLPYLEFPDEKDPILGMRGIRLLLDYPDLLELQLKALLQLACEYSVRILVPMVTLAEEMRDVKAVLAKIPRPNELSELPPLGAMIETPAAALCAEAIGTVSDFISIGTNDLTQYTMVAGRENIRVERYYDPLHPAVLKLINAVASSAQRAGVPVEVCGEMAADAVAIPHLIEAGIEFLSVAPLRIPVVKQWIRNGGRANE